MAENELMHYGVEGMKWGIRRYQYEDGSLTPLGREHYGLHNLSEVTGEIHTDTANKNAVKERKKRYALINRRKNEDIAKIRLEALEKFGPGKDPKKKKWIEKEIIDVIDSSYAAKIEVDNYLKAIYGDLSVGELVDDDVERGRRVVEKNKKKVNKIIKGAVIGGLAFGAGMWWKNKHKGGHP